MHTKAKIFNLALGALLLQRRIVNTETDPSNEAKVLTTHYEVAYASTLEDLDLDSTSSQVELELLFENPTDHWLYAYKYPDNCAFLRRLQSSSVVDNRTSHIPKRVGIHEGEKVIFTNQVDAIAEYIPQDLDPSFLSATAGLCVAYRLASLAAPLAVGKGSKQLILDIEKKYVTFKGEAQEQDRKENFNFVDEAVESEFVEARTT